MNILAHFIPSKGKGKLMLVSPLGVAIVLFILFDVAGWGDKYAMAVTMIVSALIIWFWDNGPSIINREPGYEAKQGKHSVLFIDMKYWAIVLGIAGAAWLGDLLSN